MAKSNRLWRLGIVLGLIVVIIAGCNEEPAMNENPDEEENVEEKEKTGPITGGTLDVARFQDPTLDPLGFEKKDQYYSEAEQLVYEGLFGYDGAHKPVPVLAADYEIVENEEGIQMEIRLKEGITWHDGEPLKPEDVVFSLQTYLDPYYYGVWNKDLQVIKGVSDFRAEREEQIRGIEGVPEENRIILHMNAFDVSIYHALTAPILPKHQLAERSFSEMASLAAEGQLSGTGPFRIEERTEQNLHFVRNENYHGQTPHMKKVAFTRVQADTSLSWDKYDMARVTPSQLRNLPESYESETVTGKGYQYVGINHKIEPLGQRQVRLALYWATSRSSLIEEIFQGNADPMKLPISPASWVYNEEENLKTEQNPLEAARKMMEEAGYDESSPLTLSLAYSKGSEMWERMAQLLKEQWAEVHVELQIEGMDQETFISDIYGGAAYDLFLFGGQFDPDFSALKELWHGQEVAGELGLNPLGYHNKSNDQTLDSALSAKKPEQFKAFMLEWQKGFMQDIPIIPLTVPQEMYAVSPSLRNATPTAMQPYVRVEEWWLKSDEG